MLVTSNTKKFIKITLIAIVSLFFILFYKQNVLAADYTNIRVLFYGNGGSLVEDFDYYDYYDVDSLRCTYEVINDNCVAITAPIGSVIKIPYDAFYEDGFYITDFSNDQSISDNGTIKYYDNTMTLTTSIADDNGNLVLYGHWQNITYYVKYNSGAGYGEMTKSTFKYNNQSAQYLKKCTFTNPGYVFTGWIVQNGEKEGDSLTDQARIAYQKDGSYYNLGTKENEVIILVAQWQKNAFKIEYDKNSDEATGITDATIVSNSKSSFKFATNNYEREGYAFVGWAFYSEVPDEENDTINFMLYETYDQNEKMSMTKLIDFLVSTGQTEYLTTERKQAEEDYEELERLGEDTSSIDLSKYSNDVIIKTGSTITVYAVWEEAVSLRIQWDDNLDQDGLRPSTQNVSLVMKGSDIEDKVLLTINASEIEEEQTSSVYLEDVVLSDYTFTAITNDIDEYTVSIVSSERLVYVKFSHTVYTKVLNITTHFEDESNKYGFRPYTYVISITGSDGSSYSYSIDCRAAEAEETYGEMLKTYSFPKNANGEEIEYTIDVISLTSRYDYSISGGRTTVLKDFGTAKGDVYDYTITLSYIDVYVTLNVNVVWDDNDNNDGLRPDYIKFRILSNSDLYTKVRAVTASDNWTTSFEIPKYYNRLEEVYNIMPTSDELEAETEKISNMTADEYAEYLNNNSTGILIPEIANGYSITVTKTDNYNFTLTYTKENMTTDIRLYSINFNDNGNAAGYRPSSVTVSLTGSNGYSSSKTIKLNSSGTAWTKDDTLTQSEIDAMEDYYYPATWSDLPVYSAGEKITYTLSCENISNYTWTATTNTTSSQLGFSVQYNLIEETNDITVVFKWDDNNNSANLRPSSFDIVLSSSETTYTQTLNTGSSNSVVFSNVKAKDNDGNSLSYKISLKGSLGSYNATIETITGGYQVTLTLPDSVSTNKETTVSEYNPYNDEVTNPTRLYSSQKKLATSGYNPGAIGNAGNITQK